MSGCMCEGLCATEVFNAFRKSPSVVVLRDCPIDGRVILFADNIEKMVRSIIRITRTSSPNSYTPSYVCRMLWCCRILTVICAMSLESKVYFVARGRFFSEGGVSYHVCDTKFKTMGCSHCLKVLVGKNVR